MKTINDIFDSIFGTAPISDQTDDNCAEKKCLPIMAGDNNPTEEESKWASKPTLSQQGECNE